MNADMLLTPEFVLAIEEDAAGLGMLLDPLAPVDGSVLYELSGDASFDGGRVGSGRSPIKTSSYKMSLRRE